MIEYENILKAQEEIVAKEITKLKELKKAVKTMERYHDYQSYGYGKCPNYGPAEKLLENFTNSPAKAVNDMINVAVYERDSLWQHVITKCYDNKLSFECYKKVLDWTKKYD